MDERIDSLRKTIRVEIEFAGRFTGRQSASAKPAVNQARLSTDASEQWAFACVAWVHSPNLTFAESIPAQENGGNQSSLSLI